MDPDFLNAFTQPSTLDRFLTADVIAKGEKRKLIKPTSSNNPKLEELKLFLTEWINRTLKEEHIVVKSLEEDLYDGLVLHHLLENLGSLKLDVEKIALTEKKQRKKLSVILEVVAKCLQLEESQLKWSVESILAKDLLSTLHLLVAIAKHFEPTLVLPPNVQVETITIETTSGGLKTSNAVEYITEKKENIEAQSKDDAFDELFSCDPDKLDAVKKALLEFVDQHVGKLGLIVKDIESQFSDGVILLLLIGQLEGYFLNLRNFFLTPVSTMEMLHNVNLALELLAEGGLLNFPVNSEGSRPHSGCERTIPEKTKRCKEPDSFSKLFKADRCTQISTKRPKVQAQRRKVQKFSHEDDHNLQPQRPPETPVQPPQQTTHAQKGVDLIAT